jgi:hypothetical protein
VEDEDENEDDIPVRCFFPAQYLHYLATCCQIEVLKGLVLA